MVKREGIRKRSQNHFCRCKKTCLSKTVYTFELNLQILKYRYIECGRNVEK